MKYGCRVVPEDESGVGKQGSEGARVRAPRVSMYFTAGDTGRLRESARQVFHSQIQTSRSISPSSSSGLLFYTVGRSEYGQTKYASGKMMRGRTLSREAECQDFSFRAKKGDYLNNPNLRARYKTVDLDASASTLQQQVDDT